MCMYDAVHMVIIKIHYYARSPQDCVLLTVDNVDEDSELSSGSLSVN